jgi:DNA-binding NarL/FixJ family response regulator
MSSTKIRILLVDDHPIVRRGFQLLISLERDMMVCGEAQDAPEALQKMTATKPDVVVVDLALKSSSGLELVKQIRAVSPETKILVFSMQAEELYAERALRAGANGYLAKEAGTEKAIDAIRALKRGENYVSEKVSARIVGRLIGGAKAAQSVSDLLSDRELEVLELIGNGLSSQEIASRLRVSVKTIESHREHLKAKLRLAKAKDLEFYSFNWVREQQSKP